MQIFRDAVGDIPDGFLVSVPGNFEAVFRPCATDFRYFRRDRVTDARIAGRDGLALRQERIHSNLVYQRVHIGAGDLRSRNAAAERRTHLDLPSYVKHQPKLNYAGVALRGRGCESEPTHESRMPDLTTRGTSGIQFQAQRGPLRIDRKRKFQPECKILRIDTPKDGGR